MTLFELRKFYILQDIVSLLSTKNSQACSPTDSLCLYLYLCVSIYPFIAIFLVSSPEPKAQGELLVSKGDAPASVVMRQQSSSSLKLLGRLTSNLVCSILVTVTLEFAHVISIGPFKGSAELKIEKPSNIFFYRTNGWMIAKLCL
jgi:hypothetical protein